MTQQTVFMGLINPKSPDNVASVMRASGNYQVNQVFYTGIRYPMAIKRNPRAVDMARKVSQHIPLNGVDDLILQAIHNMSIVCVEFAENAIPLPNYQHPTNAFYIFGPEDNTLSQNIIDQADDVIYIPTVGCMNLAATANVILYDRLAKSNQSFEGNTSIRQNRDTNNVLVVKIK